MTCLYIGSQSVAQPGCLVSQRNALCSWSAPTASHGQITRVMLPAYTYRGNLQGLEPCAPQHVITITTAYAAELPVFGNLARSHVTTSLGGSLQRCPGLLRLLVIIVQLEVVSHGSGCSVQLRKARQILQ